MNRRTFFNFLGSVTLGTIIALKLPDVLAPIIKEEDYNHGVDAIFELLDRDLSMAFEILQRNVDKSFFS